MSSRLSPTSRRDTWDYFRINPDAVALSNAQAQELCRLDDDVKRHLFSHFPEFLRCLLPEDRDTVMASIGRFDTADRIPDRRTPASVARPDLADLASPPLSDDDAAAVLVETLAVVEEAGETLRRKLRTALTNRDRDELHKLMSSNIWSRWFLSHVIAPFLDDYAIILDGMGIDPEQIRRQAASHHAARAFDAPSPSPQPRPAPANGDAAAAVSSSPLPAASPRTSGLPTALGTFAATPAAPDSRPQPSPSTTGSAAPAAPIVAAAPSLPTSTTPPAPRRPFSTTVTMGQAVVAMDVIDRVADAVPHPKAMKTAELVTSYGTLLQLTDAIEARLRADLPDVPFGVLGDPANASLLPVITHPLGKSYARALANRVTIATTLLDRPDIAPHLATGLRDLHARLTADSGRTIPILTPTPATAAAPAHAASPLEVTPSPQPDTVAQPPSPPNPPATPSAAIATVRATATNPAPPSPPASSVAAVSEAAPPSALPAAHPGPAVLHPHTPVAAAAPTPPTPFPPPTPILIPTTSPGTAFPDPPPPFPGAPRHPLGPPLAAPPPSLTAGPLSPTAAPRKASGRATPLASMPPSTAAPTRRLVLPSLRVFLVPAAAAIDLIVTCLRTRRKAAEIKRAARRPCPPPLATQPNSTAVGSLLRVVVYTTFFIAIGTAGIFGWRVYQAPPSWLLAAPPQTRYVVPAYKALVPVYLTPEDARLSKIDPGRTPTINPGARYPVTASQGDVLQIAITDTKGRATTGWVSADLMRDAPSPF